MVHINRSAEYDPNDDPQRAHTVSDGGEHIGIYGKSTGSTGVYGESQSGEAVFGTSGSGDGVLGASGSGDGVSGISGSGAAIHGQGKLAGLFDGNVQVNGTCTVTADVIGGGIAAEFVGDLHVNGTHRTNVLEILGADVAESFDIDEVGSIEPGNVMIIDDNHSGNLKMSHLAYDHRVAGVVSGALGLGPGVILRADKVVPERRHIALIGRVYCKAEASSSPIAPGDMLTTSNIPGHAMRALDKTRSHGAILGKAMSSLESGTGLVMVLVNLQ